MWTNLYPTLRGWPEARRNGGSVAGNLGEKKMKSHMTWKVRAKDLAWFGISMDRRKATKYARKAYKTGRQVGPFYWTDLGLEAG
jgi:hypothetical protein